MLDFLGRSGSLLPGDSVCGHRGKLLKQVPYDLEVLTALEDFLLSRVTASTVLSIFLVFLLI